MLEVVPEGKPAGEQSPAPFVLTRQNRCVAGVLAMAERFPYSAALGSCVACRRRRMRSAATQETVSGERLSPHQPRE